MTLTEQTKPSAAGGSGVTTVASLARDWAQRAPEQVAMREKDFGIWREVTWGEAWETIEDLAHGLIALGVEPGDRVSIHAEDRPEWVLLDLATVAVRGVTVGFYPTNPAAEVDYLLKDCGASVHFAEDEEQFDKVDEIDRAELAGLRTIIFVEPRGMVGKTDDRLLFWDNLIEMGREHKAQHPTAVADRMAAATDDDIMTLVYTSGTTGPPKGAMLSNKNSAFCIEKIVNAADRVPGGPPNPKDQIVTYLPLCHVAERIFSTWTMVGAGPVLNFAESIETVNENLREVQPTIFFAVPRIWEKLHALALIKANDASWFKRKVMGFGMTLANKVGKAKVANGGDHTVSSRVLAAIGWVLVFRALRERLGLRRVRYASSGAAAIAPEVLEFFIGLGVPVYELYGMTENSAIATANFVGRMKLGTVGEPYADIGFRIADDTGEIQTKHDGNFQGYWNKPDKTAETFTEDGWLMTGDVGEWVDGTHVRIVDRIKHIIITSGGKNISPSEIENSLKTSPYVNEAMVVGEGRKYLTALVGIELDTVGDWALRRGLPYTTYRDLAEKPEVVELIQTVVDQTNERFARVENIRKFALLPKELDHEDGELTATQKLKRSAMIDAFGDLVEAMY
ncbi:AMP-dependent synthetase/ligase [Ilumatobacter sp.]|uniref:AMP-dependent synthetase/ligase n=1 Tax=Ilumatobacter sp. TaxID=1967498 RepID=UPI003AF6EF53